MAEPLFHSHITDVLPDGHPLAYETVFCVACGEMVHSCINECMDTWVETGRGAWCFACFYAATTYVEPLRWHGGMAIEPAVYHLLSDGGWELPDPL